MLTNLSVNLSSTRTWRAMAWTAQQRNSVGGRERPQRCWATGLRMSQMFPPPWETSASWNITLAAGAYSWHPFLRSYAAVPRLLWSWRVCVFIVHSWWRSITELPLQYPQSIGVSAIHWCVAVCAVNCTVDGRSCCSHCSSHRSIARYSSRIAICTYPTCIRRPRWGGFHRNIAMTFGTGKLE